jgi:hypothetical protein
MFQVSGISHSGWESENSAEITITGLQEAREYAHLLLSQADMFTAWVQGDGVNECHTANCRVVGCPACE